LSNSYAIEIDGKQLSEMSLEELRTALDMSRLPRHVAIIMDGNGRWAAARGLPRVAGHKKGMETVREVLTSCSRLGLEALTLYAFSIENWKRPEMEVDALMSLLRLYLINEQKLMMDNDVRFSTIGRVDDLPKSVREWLDKVKTKTASNRGMMLNLALSYGGRWEIVEAARRFAREVRDGKLEADSLTEDMFSEYMSTVGIPDPDLVIRTSGENRISNFLLWQSAYAEYHFTDTLWPDFGERGLLAALVDYQHRERRFGRTSGQLEGPNAG